MPSPTSKLDGGLPSVAPRCFRLAFALVLLLLGTSCASSRRANMPKSGSAGPAQKVEQLHMLLTAVAVDIDGKPGPDGFGVRLYASNRRSSDAPPITDGKLEMVMFDGAWSGPQLESATPLKIWTFDAGELRARAHKTSIGMSYQFVLGWGENRPTKSLITVRARYTPEKGTPVLSGPGTIPIAWR